MSNKDVETVNSFGFTIDDYATDNCEIEIFPCNYAAVDCFMRLSTQWRISNSCFIGLDYNTFSFVFDMCGISHEKRSLVFDKIRIMESESLSILNGVE